MNRSNNNGYVPIMCFARNGDDKSITELIRAGADVNIVNNLGETAMKIARAKGNFKCIGILVEAGAVVNDDDEKKKVVWVSANSSNVGLSSGSNHGYPGGASNYAAGSTSFVPPTAPTPTGCFRSG